MRKKNLVCLASLLFFGCSTFNPLDLQKTGGPSSPPPPPLATQAEMEAGTVTSPRLVSPLLTAQAINALAGAGATEVVDAEIGAAGNTDTTHSYSKDDIHDWVFGIDPDFSKTLDADELPSTVILESEIGSAATRDAEDTLTNGANLPDGAAIIAYGNANWGAAGTVDTSGTPVANDYARFTDADTIEGRSAAEAKADFSIDDLVTLSGVSDGAQNLGTFTGSTISDSQTIKAALQEVETYVEGLAGGHSAVTLDATIDSNLLSLSTQELGLDTQTANTVFAGPSSGAAAAPAFRALVDDDIPNDITITESDPNALLTAGTDNIKDTHLDFGTGAGQISADDIPDGSIGAIITLTQESNFTTAYGWGDHSTQNYFDKDTDTLDPDDITGDTVDDDLIDQAVIAGFGASATPKLTLDDSDGADGFISLNAADADDSVMDIGVDDSTGDDVSYVQFDGVNEQAELKKKTVFESSLYLNAVRVDNGSNYIDGAAIEDAGIAAAKLSSELTIETISYPFDPSYWYDQESNYHVIPLFKVEDRFPTTMTLDSWSVSYVGGDPTTELDADLVCDSTPDYNPAAGATVMDVIDTTAGSSSASSGFDSGTCANGNIVYIRLGSDPTDANVIVHFQMEAH